MSLKTQVTAEEGKQDLLITREFELPVDLLFKAYTEPECLEEWMGTKVVKLEAKRHGAYQFVTTDPMGNKHAFSGVIHEFVENEKITRTFEMENVPFGISLEFLEFVKLGEDTSKLNMQIVYRNLEYRAQYLKIGMDKGVNMAHNMLQKAMNKYKK
jgi:uncharacterized protein YndB with AHSA1/START domain